MKNVLLSIQPKWCEKIANGEKTIEVRKNAPKEVPFKVYIYETKESKRRYLDDRFNSFFSGKSCYTDMGKVIGEFICDKVDTYNFHNGLTEFNATGLPCRRYGSYLIFADNYSKMCLSYDEVKAYGKGKTLYGWHISDLKIYDKPRELNEFTLFCKDKGERCECCLHFVEAFGGCCNVPKIVPRGWQYVEAIE